MGEPSSVSERWELVYYGIDQSIAVVLVLDELTEISVPNLQTLGKTLNQPRIRAINLAGAALIFEARQANQIIPLLSLLAFNAGRITKCRYAAHDEKIGAIVIEL